MRPHRKLLVWQESIFFTKEVYKLCRYLPDSEKFGLESQLKRAAVSIAANISEGAARQSKKEFLRFLYISMGSCSEIDTFLELLNALNFAEEEFLKKYFEMNERISAMLNGLIKSLSLNQKTINSY
jgi:four helix bundle protein